MEMIETLLCNEINGDNFMNLERKVERVKCTEALSNRAQISEYPANHLVSQKGD